MEALNWIKFHFKNLKMAILAHPDPFMQEMSGL